MTRLSAGSGPSYPAPAPKPSWVGMEGTLGKDYFPKLVEVTQPAVYFRTEEVMQKAISCEYPIALWQLPARAFQRIQEDPTLDLGLAWPQEGVTLLGVPFAIFKGAKHPSAAKLRRLPRQTPRQHLCRSLVRLRQ